MQQGYKDEVKGKEIIEKESEFTVDTKQTNECVASEEIAQNSSKNRNAKSSSGQIFTRFRSKEFWQKCWTIPFPQWCDCDFCACDDNQRNRAFR